MDRERRILAPAEVQRFPQYPKYDPTRQRSATQAGFFAFGTERLVMPASKGGVMPAGDDGQQQLLRKNNEGKGNGGGSGGP